MPNKSVESEVLAGVGRAMGEFSMLRPGDRIAVGVSGGKDSLCLLDALALYRKRAPFDYQIVAVTIEQGKFQMPVTKLRSYMQEMNVDWIVREEPRTLRLVEEGVEHGCDVCSRNRRGALYQVASELGCSVLALGHTADDCAESLLRNILFNGRIASLPPMARSRRGSIRIIRPLVYVSEQLTALYAKNRRLDPIGCVCSEREGPRREIRSFLDEMSSCHVDVSESISAALANVNPYTLFDQKLQKEGADMPAFRDDCSLPDR